MNAMRKFWLKFAPLIIACLVCIMVYLLWYRQNDGTYRRLTNVADVDNDDDLDVILVGTRWEGASNSFAGAMVWYNQGQGKFVLGEQRFGGYSVGTDDVDGDGDADLLVLDGLLNLYLNQGGAQGGELGIFEIHNPIYPVSLIGWRGHMDMGGSVSLGDLNHDGEVDGLVTACCYGKSGQSPEDDNGLTPSFSWVWLNEWDPRGWLVRHSQPLPELDELPIPAAALGDLDQDGDLDAFVVVSKPRAGTSSSLADRVLLNDGTGMLTDSGQRLGESDSNSVALGDIDADGDLDALVAAREGVTLWTNQGGAQAGTAGTFDGYTQIISTIGARQVLLHDLDNDNDLDIILAGKRRAKLWWNDGLGGFTPSGLSFPLSQRQGLAVGDFNGNGSAELFIAEETGYQIWYISSP
jgi:hypothetical protein